MSGKNTLENVVVQLNRIPAEKESQSSKDPVPPEYSESLQNRDLDREDRAQDIELKKRIFTHVIYITHGWLIFTALLFIVNGVCHSLKKDFLSDSILIALISGTSLSVITGLVTTILRYLFPKR